MHTADANSLGNNRFVALLLALVLTSANARAADPSPATPTRPIRTLGTVEEFSPVTARYVRMTILKTAADIFPILNEVEIYAAESAPRNVALAANGGKASALATRDATWSVENLNDDRSTGWWAGQPGTNNWVQIEFPKPEVINRIVWSRSRAEPQRTVGIWSGTPPTTGSRWLWSRASGAWWLPPATILPLCRSKSSNLVSTLRIPFPRDRSSNRWPIRWSNFKPPTR